MFFFEGGVGVGKEVGGVGRGEYSTLQPTLFSLSLVLLRSSDKDIHGAQEGEGGVCRAIRAHGAAPAGGCLRGRVRQLGREGHGEELDQERKKKASQSLFVLM